MQDMRICAANGGVYNFPNREMSVYTSMFLTVQDCVMAEVAHL
jgi:hypothetical protein